MVGLTACTDPFVIETRDFEGVLVVEATLTNEIKRQSIEISRSIGLVDFGQDVETDAVVTVESSQGNAFDFTFDELAGKYLSNESFSAQPDAAYTLRINTPDGCNYHSTPVTLPPAVEMDHVYPELIEENGQEKIQILVNASSTEGAQYFRYEYEETYQLVLPHPSPFTWRIFNEDDFTRTYEIELIPRRLDLACYQSRQSAGIQQASTIKLNENKIFRFPVHTIDPGDPIIRNRYSILVKQYVQTLESYTFYKTLADLGKAESLLSQGQPGYVPGNITSACDSDEKILGFFEASSVSSERIFFNYEDVGLEEPSYFIECEHLISHEIGPGLLKRKLEFEKYQVFFFEVVPVNGSIPQPVYHISQSECSECPPFSSHIKPDFWEE